MILNANIPHQQKMYYINQVRTYFKNQYNGIKGKYDSDILNAKQEHEQFMELFSIQEEEEQAQAPAPVEEEQAPVAEEEQAPVAEEEQAQAPAPVEEEQAPVAIVTFNPNKKALLIGCNYTGTQHKLNGCINDVNNIRDRLSKKYLFEDIIIMTDKTDVKPTKNNIVEGLKNLLSNNNPGDILFFSFSGHGTNTIDTSGDEKDGMDEMLVPLDMNCISDDEIKSIIQTHLNKDVTLLALIDCCHSGSILDLRYQYSNNDSDNTISNNEGNYNTIGNVIMVSGCMDKQTSADAYISSNFQGAMTWSFLKAIKENSSICWRDLIVNMRSLLKKSKYTQIPMLSSGNELDLDNKLCLL